ncbi:MAG: Crp/Fnr family transcriptional regulator [Erysipelotrichaceae bacterium]|nr:Crp/Fnr family transcriptional regulator [Erysipelotrichaceae bacterium]
MLTNHQITILEKSLPFYPQLTADEKTLLIDNATAKRYIKGQSIFQADNDCLGILIVESGSLRTYITSEDGKEITLYRLQDNEICIFGATCILDSIDFDVNIDAETDCTIIQLSSMILQKLTTNNIYVELFAYKLATERFSDIMWAMQQILFMSFDRRLATFLLEEAQKQGSLDIKMTHEQIAKHLGSAREVVSRMLSYFAKEGYVSLSRGHILLIDKNALYKL